MSRTAGAYGNNGNHDAGAYEAADAPASPVIITDVDGDETWIDGTTGLIITGSGFTV